MLRAIALLCLAFLACGGDGPTGAPGGGTRVLFIGNSLTEWNDLPGMVRAMGAAAGTPITTGSVAVGGRSLEDHWADAAVRAAVANGRWDVVVLQQGPSALPSSRENLRELAVRWAEAIRAAGAEPMVYMVWPESWRRSAFDSVSRSYREAAEAIDAPLVPGGDAWLAAWRRDPNLALYGGDGFHPSPLGSYVVAVATWARLTGRAAADAPRLDADAAQAAVVRAAVAEVLQAPP